MQSPLYRIKNTTQDEKINYYLTFLPFNSRI